MVHPSTIISAPQHTRGHVPKGGAAALQRFLTQFPQQTNRESSEINRENISSNRDRFPRMRSENPRGRTSLVPRSSQRTQTFLVGGITGAWDFCPSAPFFAPLAQLLECHVEHRHQEDSDRTRGQHAAEHGSANAATAKLRSTGGDNQRQQTKNEGDRGHHHRAKPSLRAENCLPRRSPCRPRAAPWRIRRSECHSWQREQSTQ